MIFIYVKFLCLVFDDLIFEIDNNKIIMKRKNVLILLDITASLNDKK